jgi:hypothetical protein
MKIFDCHSHWGTKRGYIFRTDEELAQQERIWKTKVHNQVLADRGDPGAS